MSSRVPPEEIFGRQNEQRERLSRGVDDALRLGGDQYADLARRITDIEAVQATQVAQAVTLSAQQATLSAQVTFLQTQSVADSRTNTSSFTGSNSGTNWSGFDGTYDPAVTVTTGASGKLNILGSGLVAASGLGGILGVEIVGIYGPTWPGPFAGYVLGATAPGTFASIASLAANTAYTVRMRRGRSENTTGVVLWGYLSLTVTRLG